MIGEKFQSLTVIKLDDEYNEQLRKERNLGLRSSAPIHYICQCDCGNILSVGKNSLKNRKISGCNKCSMTYLKDYIGKTINSWTINDIVIKNNKYYFNCTCECGNVKNVNVYNIINNKSLNCGCGRIEYLHSQKIDLTGKKFGKLTVIENTGEQKNGRDIYKCLCDCGTYCYIRSNSLTTNHTNSCGCINTTYNNKMSEVLDELGVYYETEYHIDLSNYVDDVAYIRFDIFIPSLELAIEYDGEFHYTPIPYLDEEDGIRTLERIQYRDGVKNNFCKDHNIKLLRIPYTEKNNIKEIIINMINDITCND